MTGGAFYIFVLPTEFHEEEMEYGDAITWVNSNCLHENVNTT